ncbi:MAG TPA: VOC family protein [Candidatus Polarisedimenticolia bacterium]|nr:VOC family protein [Candidatus Polarisedimenticolia bacterium]
MSGVKPVPEGYSTITPHLVVDGAAEAIEFYVKAFGAEEISRMPGPNGRLMHAEIRIGDSRVMLVDTFPQWGSKGPDALGGSPVTIHIYVDDADALFTRAVAAGARVTLPIADMFWGDRYGKLEDPFGHKWSIASRIENLSSEEIVARAPTQGA